MSSESCVKLFFFNYIDESILANSFVSSEQASFPVSNAYNLKRRSKVYRSDGFFDVTSADNEIVFRESIGVDLVATIAVGEYASRTAYMAAVKAALEDAGASTYTVSNSSSTGFKFNILSNGSGGGGIFQLRVTDAGFTAADTLGFDDGSNLTGALTYTADFLRINTSEWVLCDMGVSTNPKAIIIIGPRNSPLKISPDAIIKIQASDNDAWNSPGYEETLTYNDKNIYQLNEDGLADRSYRYWRILIEDQNPNGYVEIGAMFLGNYFNPVRGRAQFPLPVSLIDSSEVMESEGGQIYVDEKEVSAAYQLRWFGLQKADIEEFENQFQVYGRKKPFFVQLDTEANFSSGVNRRVILGKIVSDSTPWSLLTPDNFELNFTIKEDL